MSAGNRESQARLVKGVPKVDKKEKRPSLTTLAFLDKINKT